MFQKKYLPIYGIFATLSASYVGGGYSSGNAEKAFESGIGTTLTQIEGVGGARARTLLRQFGSLKAIRSATVDELAAVKGMNRPAAEAIRAYFDNEDN